MKKTYNIPSMEIVEIKTQQILMMSTLGTTDVTSGNLAPELDVNSDLDIEINSDLDFDNY